MLEEQIFWMVVAMLAAFGILLLLIEPESDDND